MQVHQRRRKNFQNSNLGINNKRWESSAKPITEKQMNAQHKFCKRKNRLRRIVRRITELESDKASEVIHASQMKRDPNLGGILANINRLENRRLDLVV